MKLLNRFFLFSILCSLLVSSCNKDDDELAHFYSEFDSILESKYKLTNPFEGEQSDIYDTWEAIRIEQGGIAGVTNLPAEFDFLLVKPNGIFGIVRNDSLITSGEIVNIENTDDLFQIKFESEVDPETLDIQILDIDRITVQMDEGGTMRLLYATTATVLTNN